MPVRLLVVTLLAIAISRASAQSEVPTNLEAIPEPPPLPAAVESGEFLEPDVRIIQGEQEVITEYVVGGRLRAIKVRRETRTYRRTIWSTPMATGDSTAVPASSTSSAWSSHTGCCSAGSRSAIGILGEFSDQKNGAQAEEGHESDHVGYGGENHPAS